MSSALIGCSGFVGSTLLRQRPFGKLFRSTNISEISGQSFDLVICAGAPAQKWLANQNPDVDRCQIDCLTECLSTVRCDRFVLISTVDVFSKPIGVAENTVVDEIGLSPYGYHRRLLEKHVEQVFPGAMIVRLPALVGPGLRKNVVFDLLNNNNLHAIDSRSVFQFYPMVNLWHDIQTALATSLKLVHLTAEPVSVAELADCAFGRFFRQTLDGVSAVYDFQSQYAALFGGQGRYQYSRRETMQAIRAYVQSETPTVSGETKDLR